MTKCFGDCGQYREWTYWPQEACLPNYLCGLGNQGVNELDKTSPWKQGVLMLQAYNAGKATLVANYFRPADSPWWKSPEMQTTPKAVPTRLRLKEPWEKRAGVTTKALAQPAPKPDPDAYRTSVRQVGWWWLYGPRPKDDRQGSDERPPLEPPPRPGPPDPGTKERKITINGRSGPMRLVGAVTEGLDLLECLWGALPDSAKTKPWEGEGTKPDSQKGTVDPETGKLKKPAKSSRKITPQQKMRDLYDAWDQMDIGEALMCIGLNEIEDRAIGWNARQWSNFARKHGVRGLLIGPAM